MLISCVVYHTVGSLVTLSWLEQGAGRPVVAKTAFFDGFGWVMSLQDASLWAQLLDGSQVVVATTQAVYVAEDGARRVLALDNGIIQVLCHPSLVCVPVLFVATLLLRHLARTKRGARRGGGGAEEEEEERLYFDGRPGRGGRHGQRSLVTERLGLINWLTWSIGGAIAGGRGCARSCCEGDRAGVAPQGSVVREEGRREVKEEGGEAELRDICGWSAGSCSDGSVGRKLSLPRAMSHMMECRKS